MTKTAEAAVSSSGVRSLTTFNVLYSYFYALTHWDTIVALVVYLRTVLRDFFFLQFSVKWGWRKIEIINVDHELDDTVPFTPSQAPVYLDFVNFWIRPLTMMCLKLKKRASPYMARYLRTIERAYAEAARFYRFRMTTTNRPTAAQYRDKNFDTIRRLDPHYLCVPSLHISIMILAFSFFRDLFDKEDFSAEEKDLYNRELYAGAVEIAETVLYVKQHSVNCIPAALYMMTYTIPDLFTIEDAIGFIDSLFVSRHDIEPRNVSRIREHLHHLFEQLLLEGRFEDNWIEPMKRWLLKYQAENNR